MKTYMPPKSQPKAKRGRPSGAPTKPIPIAFDQRQRSYVGGGSKSRVAAALDSFLLGRGWIEKKFDTEILVDGQRLESPTHSVDCFKNGVALESWL